MKIIQSLATHPRSREIVIISLFILASPALFTGLFADDYIHYALLTVDNQHLKPDDYSLFGLFSFVDGNGERNQLLRDLNLIPWWTYDGLKYAFWRPLSEVTHWVDHQLWPRSPVLMHIHNLMWYLALCLILSKLYANTVRNTFVATAAFALYTLDATHGFSLSWIANRNSIIAATFGFASLLTYARALETGNRLDHIISIALLGLALLSAEAGVSILAYYLAHAVFLDSRSWKKRILSITPFFSLFIAWWVTYKALGFGAENADAYYIDPTSNPLGFAAKAMERIPVLLASQFGLLPAEVYGFAGKTIVPYVIVCGLFVLVVLGCCRPILIEHNYARFWGAGMTLSLAPISSALPHDRNLLFVGAGATVLIAAMLEHHLKQNAMNNRAGVARLMRAPILFLSIIPGILLMPLFSYLPKVWNDQMQLEAAVLPQEDDLHKKNILMLGTPLAAALATTPLSYYQEKALPRKLWLLSSAHDLYEIIRQDENTVLVSAEHGFVQGPERSLRDLKSYPIESGDSVVLGGMTLTVMESEGITPKKLALRFAAEEADRTLIYAWIEGRYQAFELPRLGESRIIDVRKKIVDSHRPQAKQKN